jgi:hypothetical protein
VLPKYASTFLLDLGGGGAGLQQLRSLSGCNQPEFDEPALPCRMELNGVPRPAMLAWLNEIDDPGAAPRDVSLIELDASNHALTVLTIGNAQIAQVALSDLDASSSSVPVSVVVDVTGDLLRTAGNGSALAVGSPPAQMLANNFRVTVQGAAFNRIAKVTGLAVTRDGSAASVSTELVSALTGGADALLRNWAVAAQGGERRAVTVELLNAALTSSLLTLQVSDAAPVGFPEPFGVGASTAGARVSVGVTGTYAGLS